MRSRIEVGRDAFDEAYRFIDEAIEHVKPISNTRSPGLLLTLIHPSAWKENSRKFDKTLSVGWGQMCRAWLGDVRNHIGTMVGVFRLTIFLTGNTDKLIPLATDGFNRLLLDEATQSLG